MAILPARALPSLLVLCLNSTNIEHFLLCIAYGVGLIITFAALYLMKEGQPALVYLVPSTLLTVTVISLIRKEFCNLWHGTYVR